MGVTERNLITTLQHELSCIRIKNAKLDYLFRNLSEKVDFYSNLAIETEFDRGFNKAFEIMRSMLNVGCK